ncbi:MAG: SMI1/KNR4 family protein, partial [Anaerobutyricum sp.]
SSDSKRKSKQCKELGTGSFIGSSGRTKEEIQQAEEELCICFAAEYHEYLERIGLASVEEHELTGLTKDIRLDVVAVTKEYRALYGPDTVSWYRSYEAEIR